MFDEVPVWIVWVEVDGDRSQAIAAQSALEPEVEHRRAPTGGPLGSAIMDSWGLGRFDVGGIVTDMSD